MAAKAGLDKVLANLSVLQPKRQGMQHSVGYAFVLDILMVQASFHACSHYHNKSTRSRSSYVEPALTAQIVDLSCSPSQSHERCILHLAKNVLRERSRTKACCRSVLKPAGKTCK